MGHSASHPGFEEDAMTRRSIDCRDYPDGTGCTLYLSAEEDDLVRAAAEHDASVHGNKDTPELREQIRSMLKDEVEHEAALTHA